MIESGFARSAPYICGLAPYLALPQLSLVEHVCCLPAELLVVDEALDDLPTIGRAQPRQRPQEEDATRAERRVLKYRPYLR